MKFTSVQPDLPRQIDSVLGAKLRLIRPITNPEGLNPTSKVDLSIGIDEELLDYTREAVKKLVEQGYTPRVFEQNGLVIVNHQLESLPRTPFLLPALMETSGSCGPNARAGVFVNCHQEDEGTYASFPGTGVSYEPVLSINGKTLLLGEIEDDLRTKRDMPKKALLQAERRNITVGGWVSSADEYTAEDAAQTVHRFRQAQVQKRQALEAFLEAL